MGRKRTKDKDLPQRWTRSNGAIYYQVPPGNEANWDKKIADGKTPRNPRPEIEKVEDFVGTIG